LKKIQLRRNIICPVAEELSVLDMRILGQVAAGYPAEAYNYIEERIDLNKYILGLKDDEKVVNKEGREVYDGKNRKYVKCVWATNKNMTGEGISLGDLIVIDTQKKPNRDSIILYFVDDEFVLKRSKVTKEYIELYSLDESIKPVRFEEPLSKIGVVTHVVKKFPCENNKYAGYPEEAFNYVVSGMDFNEYIIGDNYWETIFPLWAGGESMNGDGISKGDLLVVDKLRDHYDDSILIFRINEEYTLKRIVYEGDYVKLVASNPEMKPIVYKKGTEVKRWGVLTTVIKKYR